MDQVTDGEKLPSPVVRGIVSALIVGHLAAILVAVVSYSGFADTINLTAGSHFFLGSHLRLGAAIGRKVRGPQLFSVEGVFSAGWSY